MVSRRLQGDETQPDTGNEAWLLTSSALVFLMVPALSFFYGGMVSPKAVVNTMMMSFMCLAVGSVVWSLLGYSLAFGPAGLTNVLGDLEYGAFDSSDRLREGTTVSEHTYFIFQLAFNTITVAVISGGVVQRITLWAFALFSTVWTILVYCPLAHWIFYENGWLAQWGVLDFAGGLVVETASGVSAFVLAYWLGPGQTLHGGHHAPPHNIPFVLLGAGLLWVGWYGFNAGSALVAGFTAGKAFANTHLCASAAMAFVCFWAARWMKRVGVDDRLECLPCHGVAGALGILLTGLAANEDEGAPASGAFYGNPALFGKQLAALGITLVLVVVNTTLSFWIVWIVAYLLRWEVRVPDELQHDIDAAQHGETAYFDSLHRRISRGASLLGNFNTPADLQQQPPAKGTVHDFETAFNSLHEAIQPTVVHASINQAPAAGLHEPFISHSEKPVDALGKHTFIDQAPYGKQQRSPAAGLHAPQVRFEVTK